MSLPVIGIVEAGFPSPAYDFNEDRITLDEFLINRRESSYMLKVASDTFKDRGILSGDYVIVERGAEPRNGDIVVIRNEYNFTLAIFDPKNMQHTNSCIEAVVKSVVRKY